MNNKATIPNTEVAITWATRILKKREAALRVAPETLLKTPYSGITKFTTNQGIFYLKETPPALFIEAKIIQILTNEIHAIVPSILQVNKNLHCFLMIDAGIPLRDYLRNNFQPNFLEKSLTSYSNIQRKMENKIDVFFNLGVPDWRLKKLPELYQNIISKEELLGKEGLTDFELKSLRDLYPIFIFLTEILSKFNIPETVDHCDFHDNNILVNPKNNQLTLIDLGEIVITHPFFSLLSFISKAAYQYSLNSEHPIFIQLLDACYKNWLPLLGKNTLQEAMLIAKKIWPIYSALGYYRLMVSSGMGGDKSTFMSFFGSGRNRGRFAKYFKDFIKANLDIEPSDLSRVKLSDPGSRITNLL